MSERLGVNINDECANVLRRERTKGVSATESIRRAVSLLSFFTTESEQGARFFVERADGQRSELVLLSPDTSSASDTRPATEKER